MFVTLSSQQAAARVQALRDALPGLLAAKEDALLQAAEDDTPASHAGAKKATQAVVEQLQAIEKAQAVADALRRREAATEAENAAASRARLDRSRKAIHKRRMAHAGEAAALIAQLANAYENLREADMDLARLSSTASGYLLTAGALAAAVGREFYLAGLPQIPTFVPWIHAHVPGLVESVRDAGEAALREQG